MLSKQKLTVWVGGWASSTVLFEWRRSNDKTEHFNLPHNFKHENIVQIVTLTGDNINQLDNV
jgi:hypothetical protein